MQLEEYIDINDYNSLLAEKMITVKHHPQFPLSIVNYSPAAQSLPAAKWSSTLRKCRGLVFDNASHKIMALPFEKFWNFNDPGIPETLLENLPEGLPRLFSKEDGSLGVGCFYQDKFVIATRGSFESDQAKWAMKWASTNIDTYNAPPSKQNKETTYLFEIVSKEDRKVVEYDFEGLVILGSRDNNTGREFDPELTYNMSKFLHNCRIAREVKIPLEEALNKDIPNEEGYVAVWYNNTHTHRVKIKFETYKKLHRLYFQTNTNVIWELAKSNVSVKEHLKDVDDNGLIKWAVRHEVILQQLYETFHKLSRDNFRFIMDYVNSQCDLDAPESLRRKHFAMLATQKSNPSLLFLLYDGKVKEYEESIWKIIKPPIQTYRSVE